MKAIGSVGDSRLTNIPKAHHASHEFCFHIHDLMVNLIREMDSSGAGAISFQIRDEEDLKKLQQSEHILDFLANSGRDDKERRVAINHLSLALYADMLHFIHAALIALEKRKFSVAFSLLRKPFKEGLILAS